MGQPTFRLSNVAQEPKLRNFLGALHFNTMIGMGVEHGFLWRLQSELSRTKRVTVGRVLIPSDAPPEVGNLFDRIMGERNNG